MGWTGARDEDIEQIASEAFLEGLLVDAQSDVVVAEEGGRLVGMSVSRLTGAGIVELSGMIVLQSRLGMGIGGGLIELAEDAALRRGALKMTVKTEAENERALGFYKSRGFKVESTAVERVSEMNVRLTRLKLELIHS